MGSDRGEDQSYVTGMRVALIHYWLLTWRGGETGDNQRDRRALTVGAPPHHLLPRWTSISFGRTSTMYTRTATSPAIQNIIV